jgi:phage terminase large subunit-like protein
MGKRGPQPLSAEEHARRGTYRSDRYGDKEGSASGPVVVEVPPMRDYVGIARQYAADVLSAKVPACQWVKLACERQDRDQVRAATDESWPYVWSDTHAVDACHFLEHLPHVEGKWGKSTIVLEPCQIFWVTCLFGWRQKADESLRRFVVMYLELGRKGAKSTLAAGIALYHLLRENEPGASIVCGATTGSQARIVFGIAQRMVKKSPWLRAQGVEALANSILTEDGTIKPINAKASTQDGLNPSCIVLDESHAQKYELHDVLKSAQGARTNPLLLAPTTAGYDLLSVGYGLRTTLTKVLQGIFENDHFFGVIYTLDESDDWRDERAWVKSMPMLGKTPTIDYVRRYCKDAQQTQELEGEFRVKLCSQWMQSSAAWLSMTQWDACADTSIKLEDFKGQKCWIGADLAETDDIAAVALLFLREKYLYVFTRFYLPRHVVEERARAVPAYMTWVNQGILHLSEGSMTDHNQIQADIRGWCKVFNVAAIRFDQHGSAFHVSALADDGFPAAILDKNARNFTPPSRDLEARIKHGLFRHDGNSCLKWMASNVVVKRGVDGSLLPKKESAESPNKIDGIDAILQAQSAMLGPAEKEKSFQLLVLGGR